MKKSEKIVLLAEKVITEWTSEDKDFIKAEAEKAGLRLNTACSNCWHDAAVQLASKDRKQSGKTKKEVGGYELQDGLDIVLHSFKHGTLHICAKELTKENAERWLAAGLPKRFFKKMPQV